MRHPRISVIPGTVATLQIPTSIAKTYNLTAMAFSPIIKQFQLYPERAGRFGLDGSGHRDGSSGQGQHHLHDDNF